jgi:hypothetical protein
MPLAPFHIPQQQVIEVIGLLRHLSFTQSAPGSDLSPTCQSNLPPLLIKRDVDDVVVGSQIG